MPVLRLRGRTVVVLDTIVTHNIRRPSQVRRRPEPLVVAAVEVTTCISRINISTSSSNNNNSTCNNNIIIINIMPPPQLLHRHIRNNNNSSSNITTNSNIML